MTTAYYSYQEHFLHNTGSDHPEHALRLLAIEQELKKRNLWDQLVHVNGQPANMADILRTHSPKYVEELQLIQPAQGHIYLDEDTPMSTGTLEAALYSVGSCTSALDALMNNEFQNAFVAARPPGHHAEYRKGMGFCFLNNIAVTALRAAEVHHLQRIAILDFDAHQGNGTVDILKDDSRFLILSSFQHPFFPHSFYQENLYNNLVNVYLDAGAGSEAFREGVSNIWQPALSSYAPELILVSAGFDAHTDDHMTELNFSDDDYHWIGEWIQKYSQAHQIPWLATLEGGYNLNALGRSSAEFIAAMLKTDSL